MKNFKDKKWNALSLQFEIVWSFNIESILGCYTQTWLIQLGETNNGYY